MNGNENYQLLFWKVFKNVYLFKKIMNHTHYLKNLIKSYDSIISVEEMLNENKIEMLKDKVKRNQYLVFSGGCFRILFSKIQDDIGFYECLFKYYNKSIPDFNNSQIFFAMELSHCNCFGGLQIYIEQYNFKADQRLLNKAVESGSINVIEQLIKLIEPTTIKINEIWNSLFGLYLTLNNKPSKNKISDIIFKRYQTIIELFSTTTTTTTTTKTTTTTTTTTKTTTTTVTYLKLINDLQSPQSKENYENTINNKFKTVLIDPLCPLINDFNLNDLINACHSIIIILSSNDLKNQIDIEKIINNKNKLFSKKQLESTITSPINHDCNDKILKNNIRLLLDFYYSNFSNYLNCSKIFLNIYYGNNNQEDENFDGIFNESLKYLNGNNNSFEVNSIQFFKQILKLGNFKLLKEWFEFVSPNSITIIKTLMYEDSKKKTEIKNYYLFSNCKNDLNIQINFIDLVINDFKNKKINQKKKLDIWFLFFCLVGFDNIKLIKHFINKLKGENGNGNNNNNDDDYFKTIPTTINDYDHFPLLISGSIKSIEMLDFIGKEFPQLLFNNEYSIWFHLKNLNLLKYYIESFNKITNQYPTLKLNNFEIPSSVSFSIIRYVIENPNIFKYDKAITSIKPFDLNCYSNDELISTYQYIVKNTDINFSPSLYCSHYQYDLIQPPIFILQFINWLFDNYNQDDFKSNGRFHFKNDCFLIKYLYLTGRFSKKMNIQSDQQQNSNDNEQDEIVKNIELFSKKYMGIYTSIELIYKFITNYLDTTAFDFIMDKVYKKFGSASKSLLNDIKYNIFDILSFAVESGQLKFLQHIQSHHSILLSTNLKFSLLSNKELLNFASISLSNDFIEITEFFLDFKLVNFNKDFFEKSTPIFNTSYTYFKNRFEIN
ncbi:hypothetical protein ACTFIZ_008030 [Dictyostelium cf. discoideum]